MYLLIDNYDSFTYNIYQYLSLITDRGIAVRRNNEITLQEIEDMNPEGIVISPGPGRPAESGIILECIRKFKGRFPMLGICLGHQAIGEAFGGKIVQAGRIFHGKTDRIVNDGRGVFRNLAPELDMTRYHSLVIERESFPGELEITALSGEGEIMGVRHRHHDIEGVQFHPESYASESGFKLLKNFINYRRDSVSPKTLLTSIMKHKSLTMEEAGDFMEELTEGNLDEAVTAAFLASLNTKGVAVEEIAGCASVLLKKKKGFKAGVPLLDTCGTGGDGLGTYNISSLAAVTASACGVNVAKHGNRAVSSLAGSYDFYRELGIPVDLGPDAALEMIHREGFAFLFAPLYHSAMRFAAPVRQKLGFKTIMNLLGPLVNPGNAEYQLTGVYDSSLSRIMAQAAKLLGRKRIMVVHGYDGEDEISVTGPTRIVTIFEDGEEKIETFEPEKNSLPLYSIKDLTGGNASYNAKAALALAEGRGSKALFDSVCLNTGAALFVYGSAESIMEGYETAADAFRQGRVREKIERLKSFRLGSVEK